MITYKNIIPQAFIKLDALPKVEKPETLRNQHLVYAINNLIKQDGIVMEFGVWKGKSINCIADALPDEKIYGFDSFEGLPEDWYKKEEHKTGEESNKHVKGWFALDNLPSVRSNVELVKGFYDVSLVPWLGKNNVESIKLLHIDCDLYSSTAFVLDTLNKFIVPGTIIIFDELYPFIGEENYPLWHEGEWKALVEWMKKYDRTIQPMTRTNGYETSIKIV